MSNRKQLEIWKSKAAAQRNGLPAPEYQATQVTTSTKAKHQALMKAILRARPGQIKRYAGLGDVWKSNILPD